MANPTGGYLTENTGYVWADGDIYEIAQTDTAEGAATGASFSGLGVENEPHQVLLNKIKLTHTKQIADENNIAALQAFVGLFTGTIGQNGFVKIPFLDSVHGSIELIVQWGFYSFVGLNLASVANEAFAVTFPTAFTTACYMTFATFSTNNVGHPGAFYLQSLTMEPVGPPYGLTGVTYFVDQANDAAPSSGTTVYIANPSAGIKGLTGFQWVAIGY